MDIGTISLLLMMIVIGLVVVFVLLLSSRANRQVWQPVNHAEKEMISPIAMVEESHMWYVASKQESDLLQSLVRTSYGIACLRSVQNIMQLEEVKGATLPPAVQGPAGLNIKLNSQQAVLLNALTSMKTGGVNGLPKMHPDPAVRLDDRIVVEPPERSHERPPMVQRAQPDGRPESTTAIRSYPEPIHRNVQPRERLFRSL